jgi:hypothetical protein
VAPSEPKQKEGLYWGYSVRNIDYFSVIEKTCPFPEGYELKILVDSKYGVEFNEEQRHKAIDLVNSKGIK